MVTDLFTALLDAINQGTSIFVWSQLNAKSSRGRSTR
jgi:hypothetical protein